MLVQQLRGASSHTGARPSAVRNWSTPVSRLFAEIVDAVLPERFPAMHPIYQATYELQLSGWLPVELSDCTVTYDLSFTRHGALDVSFYGWSTPMICLSCWSSTPISGHSRPVWSELRLSRICCPGRQNHRGSACPNKTEWCG